MQRAISYQGFLAVRSGPSQSAGMISQVLFGESIRILNAQGAWLLIESDSGHDQAWVEKSGVSYLKEPQWTENEEEAEEMMVTAPHVLVEDLRFSRQLILPGGSVLRKNKRFKNLSDEGWIACGDQVDPGEVGKGFISIPMLAGGRCGFGLDAPGLVQLLCRSMGIHLPHSIKGQARQGTIVNFIHEVRKGDLAFFHKGEDHFTHVGMVLDDGKIIHVTDQVRIDRLDQQGIYCHEKENYTHQLRVVKSLMS